VPGTGGREFYCSELTKQGHTILGMDRVPFIARIKEQGISVFASKKQGIRFGVLYNPEKHDISSILSQLLAMPCLQLPNYFTVTLTPSNQILHTTRLYSMFFDKKIDDTFDKQIKFYAEWDNASSIYLLAADEELQKICRKLEAYSVDLSHVVSLRNHYEVNTIFDMTTKLKSIKSLGNINAPLILKDNQYIIDRQSRYFIEDFPCGLCIIKSIATVTQVNTPTIDKILKWFETFFSVEYFVDVYFAGKDLKTLPIPQNFGIKSIKHIAEFYNKTGCN
jgi:hypothetical protein